MNGENAEYHRTSERHTRLRPYNRLLEKEIADLMIAENADPNEEESFEQYRDYLDRQMSIIRTSPNPKYINEAEINVLRSLIEIDRMNTSWSRALVIAYGVEYSSLLAEKNKQIL